MGTQFTVTVTAPAGGTFSWGTFDYNGDSYGFMTYGWAFGIEAGISFNPIIIKVPSNFDPINDFGGLSSGWDISYGIGSLSTSSSVSYDHAADEYKADNKVLKGSIGIGLGALKVGVSYTRPSTTVWKIDKVSQPEQHHFILSPIYLVR